MHYVLGDMHTGSITFSEGYVLVLSRVSEDVYASLLQSKRVHIVERLTFNSGSHFDHGHMFN